MLAVFRARAGAAVLNNPAAACPSAARLNSLHQLPGGLNRHRVLAPVRDMTSGAPVETRRYCELTPGRSPKGIGLARDYLAILSVAESRTPMPYHLGNPNTVLSFEGKGPSSQAQLSHPGHAAQGGCVIVRNPALKETLVSLNSRLGPGLGHASVLPYEVV